MERTACCHCGSLRATVSGEPVIVNVRHCNACQRRTGAIMHSGVYFNKSLVRIEGSEKIYTRDVEGTPRTISFHFCPTCGSSVYWHLDLRPDDYGIAVGGFADPDFPCRPCRCGNRPNIPGSICRKACSIFPSRVFSHLFAGRGRARHTSQERASGPQRVKVRRRGTSAPSPFVTQLRTSAHAIARVKAPAYGQRQICLSAIPFPFPM